MALRITQEGKTKPARQVGRHTRKSKSGQTVYVNDYWQRYNKPRGEWGKVEADNLKANSRTAWLKNRAGKFVGRANIKGKTTAKGAVISKLDTTRNVRERGRYGRLKGRTS
jgi:hypothetical protein